MFFNDSRGFSLIELLMVMAIMATIAVIAVPMTGNTVRFLKIAGDARDLANATAVAKMRAAAKFTQSRVYIDLSGRTFYVQTFNKATSAWETEGGSNQLSSSVSFSYGIVTAPPSDSVLSQAPNCTIVTGSPPAAVAVANTACITFNSRGIPIDTTGSPTGLDAIYVTDNTSVYAVTVAATGFIRTWQTRYTSTPSWSLQ
jgi:prepilin-type N-terminal cleavage/methylation domain-containing protein